jgi:hypothetical protein
VQPATEPLVTVARFPSPGEAHLARTFLASQGIPALVYEQDALRFDPFRPAPAARVRLEVARADAALARQLLAAGAAEPGG